MATLQELERAEQENRQVLETPLPQRRFGAGVDVRAQQRDIVEQREAASQNIQLIQQEKQNVMEQEAQESRRIDYQRLIEKASQGSQAAVLQLREQFGDEAYRYGAQLRYSYIYGKADDLKARAQRESLKAQGFEPIYRGGELVGLKDIKNDQSVSVRNLSPEVARRLERAGIEVQKVSAPAGSTPREEQAQQSLVETERYKSVDRVDNYGRLGSNSRPSNRISGDGRRDNLVGGTSDRVVEKVASLPEEPKNAIERRQRYLQEKQQIGTEREKFLASAEQPVINIASAGYRVYSGTKTLSLEDLNDAGKKFIKSPVTNVKGAIRLFEEGAPQVGQILREEPSVVIGRLIGEAGLSYGFSKLTGYALKDVRIKSDPVKDPRFSSKAAVISLRNEGRQLNVAQFEVTGVKEARFAIEAPRYKIILARAAGTYPSSDRIKDLTLTQIQARVPGSKIMKIEPAQTSVSLTEPFIVNDKGQITGSLRGTRGVKVLTRSATRKRTGQVELGRMEGTLYGERVKYGTLDERKLPKSLQKALERVKSIQGKGEAKASLILEKGQEIDFGGIVTTKIGKLDKDDYLKPARPGKRITRAELAAIQKSKFKLETGKEYGIREVEIFDERIGVVDVTLPKLRKPRTSSLIKGETAVLDVNIPSTDTSVTFVRGKGLTLDQKLAREQALKAIAQQKAVIAAVQRKNLAPKVRPVKSPKLETTVRTTATGRFAGQGLYEKTDEVAQSVSVSKPSLASPQKAKVISYVAPKDKLIAKARQIDRVIERQVERNVVRDAVRLSPKEVIRTNVRQTPRQVQRTPLRTQLRQTPRTPVRPGIPKVPKIPRTPRTPLRPAIIPKFDKPLNKRSGGISVEIRREGKFKVIGSNLSAAQASQLARYAADTTLGRTVRLTGSKNELKKLKIDQKLFRLPKSSSRLNKPYTFVERSKFALSKRQEIASIQSARRNKR